MAGKNDPIEVMVARIDERMKTVTSEIRGAKKTLRSIDKEFKAFRQTCSSARSGFALKNQEQDAEIGQLKKSRLSGTDKAAIISALLLALGSLAAVVFK